MHAAVLFTAGEASARADPYKSAAKHPHVAPATLVARPSPAKPRAVCLAMRVATALTPVRLADHALITDFDMVATLVAACPASSPYLGSAPTLWKTVV